MLSDIGLDLLGEVVDGEENAYTYSFGDGSCGSNTSLLTKATLSFFYWAARRAPPASKPTWTPRSSPTASTPSPRRPPRARPSRTL
ncbi:hypothetical protein [Streptomyces sp. NPDC048473]|uniref:hypothetical protein n=1 Tax=unclassified Streptomyces TaxID=2593676 RepID=UPI0037118E69